MMQRYRNYWVYSIGLAVVWAVGLALALVLRGCPGTQPIVLVFLGYVLGWVSTTIARYIYPPPGRWTAHRP